MKFHFKAISLILSVFLLIGCLDLDKAKEAVKAELAGATADKEEVGTASDAQKLDNGEPVIKGSITYVLEPDFEYGFSALKVTVNDVSTYYKKDTVTVVTATKLGAAEVSSSLDAVSGTWVAYKQESKLKVVTYIKEDKVNFKVMIISKTETSIKFTPKNFGDPTKVVLLDAKAAAIEKTEAASQKTLEIAKAVSSLCDLATMSDAEKAFCRTEKNQCFTATATASTGGATATVSATGCLQPFNECKRPDFDSLAQKRCEEKRVACAPGGSLFGKPECKVEIDPCAVPGMTAAQIATCKSKITACEFGGVDFGKPICMVQFDPCDPNVIKDTLALKACRQGFKDCNPLNTATFDAVRCAVDSGKGGGFFDPCQMFAYDTTQYNLCHEGFALCDPFSANYAEHKAMCEDTAGFFDPCDRADLDSAGRAKCRAGEDRCNPFSPDFTAERELECKQGFFDPCSELPTPLEQEKCRGQFNNCTPGGDFDRNHHEDYVKQCLQVFDPCADEVTPLEQEKCRQNMNFCMNPANVNDLRCKIDEDDPCRPPKSLQNPNGATLKQQKLCNLITNDICRFPILDVNLKFCNNIDVDVCYLDSSSLSLAENKFCNVIDEICGVNMLSEDSLWCEDDTTEEYHEPDCTQPVDSLDAYEKVYCHALDSIVNICSPENYEKNKATCDALDSEIVYEEGDPCRPGASSTETQVCKLVEDTLCAFPIAPINQKFCGDIDYVDCSHLDFPSDAERRYCKTINNLCGPTGIAKDEPWCMYEELRPEGTNVDSNLPPPPFKGTIADLRNRLVQHKLGGPNGDINGLGLYFDDIDVDIEYVLLVDADTAQGMPKTTHIMDFKWTQVKSMNNEIQVMIMVNGVNKQFRLLVDEESFYSGDPLIHNGGLVFLEMASAAPVFHGSLLELKGRIKNHGLDMGLAGLDVDSMFVDIQYVLKADYSDTTHALPAKSTHIDDFKWTDVKTNPNGEIQIMIVIDGINKMFHLMADAKSKFPGDPWVEFNGLVFFELPPPPTNTLPPKI